MSPARAVAHLSSVEVDAAEATRLAHGQVIRLRGEVPAAPSDGPVAVLRGGELVAMAAREGDRLRPRKVFLRV